MRTRLNILKATIMTISLLVISAFAGPAYVTVSAASPPPPSTPSCPSSGASSATAQVLHGLGATGSDCSGKQVNNLFAVVVNILSIIVGVLSLIVIMVSAMKYLLSGGNESKVANAKGTLIYALVGLAIAGLAQLLIHFVLYQTTHVGS